MRENLSRSSCPFVSFVIQILTFAQDRAQDQFTTSLGNGGDGDNQARAQGGVASRPSHNVTPQQPLGVRGSLRH